MTCTDSEYTNYESIPKVLRPRGKNVRAQKIG